MECFNGKIWVVKWLTAAFSSVNSTSWVDLIHFCEAFSKEPINTNIKARYETGRVYSPSEHYIDQVNTLSMYHTWSNMVWFADCPGTLYHYLNCNIIQGMQVNIYSVNNDANLREEAYRPMCWTWNIKVLSSQHFTPSLSIVRNEWRSFRYCKLVLAWRWADSWDVAHWMCASIQMRCAGSYISNLKCKQTTTVVSKNDMFYTEGLIIYWPHKN